MIKKPYQLKFKHYESEKTCELLNFNFYIYNYNLWAITLLKSLSHDDDNPAYNLRQPNK